MINLSNGGKEIALKYLTGNISTTEILLVKLFTNNATLSVNDTAASYTEVVTGTGGYSYKTLSASSWTISGNIASYPSQTWTFTGAVGNIHGYYVIRQTTGDLVFSEKFSGGPYNVQTNGDNISVTINLTIS
jgi:hypothetical protein